MIRMAEGPLETISSLFLEYGLVFIEAAGVVVILIIALLRPQLGGSWFEKGETVFGRIARKRGLSILIVGVLPLTARVALWSLLGVPEPFEDDEFSYLLAADTFASGRLTNPPHPLWPHFESYHIIQQPSYMSMYFPAQGLVLAVGQVLLGHPWFGVWLSVGLMCAVVCWMLQAWVPPGWALLGSLVVALRVGTFSYWMNSYWGGAVAAIGGALLFGSLPRLKRQRLTRHALLLGAGLAILANSRPYEGLAFSVPAVGALLFWIFDKTISPLRSWLTTVLLPLLLLVGAAAFATGFYFWRVTGDPFQMPHALNRNTYAMAPVFVWQSPKAEPSYRHREMRDTYYTELAWLQSGFSLRNLFERAKNLWCFFLGPILTLPLVALPWVLRDQRVRLLWLSCGLTILALATEFATFPHYAAPMTALIIGLVLQAMRHLRVWSVRGSLSGLFAIRALPVLLVFLAVLRVTAEPLGIPLGEVGFNPWRPSGAPHVAHRTPVLAWLRDLGGRHLVIVRHKANQTWHREWVYNRADIDKAAVVWAREMDSESNQALLDYFEGRHVWLGEPDRNPPILSPYPLSPAASAVGIAVATEIPTSPSDNHLDTAGSSREIDR